MTNRSRLLLPLAVSLLVSMLGGCTSYYRNVEACKNTVRADYPDAASAPLKLTGSAASYHGSRVVVRGEIPAPPKPPATKPGKTAVSAECLFTDETQTGFQWLSPARLAAKNKPAAE
jgi:hypothetical protein